MSLFTTNVLANFLGRGWRAALNLLTIPLYLNFIGIESYGIVGVFTTLQAAIALIYDGLYATLNRELARAESLRGNEERLRDTARTLEIIAWVMAAVISIGFVILAPSIARYWVKVQQLPPETVAKAIAAMSIALGIELPSNLYMSGLMGLQRQKLVNSIGIATGTVACLGALAVLWLVSPSIEAYALWQIPAASIRTVVAAFFLYMALPKIGRRARFRRNHVEAAWRFYMGTSIAAALSSLLLQVDKIVLSKLLPLDAFGYYSLASALALSMAGLLVHPIRDAAFPQFAHLIETRNTRALAALYHHCAQALSSILIPVAAITALFADKILLAWTGSPVTSEKVAPILRLLVIGVALRELNVLPRILQLAYGWTRLIVGMNVAALAIFAPLVVCLASFYGAIGAASAWIWLWIAYTMVGIGLMHRQILMAEQRVWYINDVGLPLLATLGVAAICRWTAPLHMSPVLTVLFLGGVLGFCVSISIVAAPQTRAWVTALVTRQFMVLAKK